MPFRPVSWSRFHRPGFSAVHFRRRLTEELLELIAFYGAGLCTRGRSMLWFDQRRTRYAETLARWRLKKAGLLVSHPRREGPPVLALAPEWTPREIHHPDRLWNQRWSGVWFMLTYDIAEQDRHLRDHLRRFLSRLRMGCFQKSVWVSARDVRPEYADLVRTTGFGLSTHLVEARTTIGCSDESMVRLSWDWSRMGERHRWYLDNAGELAEPLRRNRFTDAECRRLAREEMNAYVLAMEMDPLLPATLLPDGYLGRQVFKAHQRFLRRLRPAFVG